MVSTLFLVLALFHLSGVLCISSAVIFYIADCILSLSVSSGSIQDLLPPPSDTTILKLIDHYLQRVDLLLRTLERLFSNLL